MPQRSSDGRFTRRATDGEDAAFITITNADIYNKLVEVSDTLNPLPATVANHEKRITYVEGVVGKWVTISSLIVPSVGAVSGVLTAYFYLKH